MQLLITAATELELRLPLKHPNKTDVLITGAGVPPVMYHLQKKLQQNRYDAVIQAGIAGVFQKRFALGDVVLVKQDTFADIGMEKEGVFSSLFDGGLADRNEFPFSDGWLENNHPLFEMSRLPKVKAATVNKVSDSKIRLQQLIDDFLPDIETMEGAAFHYVCLMEKIPFIQIRSISNDVGERNKEKWKIKDAVEKLNDGLDTLIKMLQEI